MAAFDRETVLIFDDSIYGWSQSLNPINTTGFGELTLNVKVGAPSSACRYPLIIYAGEEVFIVPLRITGWEQYQGYVTFKLRTLPNPLQIDIIALYYGGGYATQITADVQYLTDDAIPIPPFEILS
jgi:hypothetical protein